MVYRILNNKFNENFTYLDIQFWRTRKSLEGLSVRSVFFNIFQSFIVLLYIFDNEANTMVRISVCVGILIELWKVPKVLNFEVMYLFFSYSNINFFFIFSVYPMKNGLELFLNINMFINNHIQIHQHQITIERLLNIFHGYYFH